MQTGTEPAFRSPVSEHQKLESTAHEQGLSHRPIWSEFGLRHCPVQEHSSCSLLPGPGVEEHPFGGAVPPPDPPEEGCGLCLAKSRPRRCVVGGRQTNRAFIGSVLGVPLAQLAGAPSQ